MNFLRLFKYYFYTRHVIIVMLYCSVFLKNGNCNVRNYESCCVLNLIMIYTDITKIECQSDNLQRDGMGEHFKIFIQKNIFISLSIWNAYSVGIFLEEILQYPVNLKYVQS